MPKLTNTRATQVTLPSGHVLPPRGSLTLAQSVLDMIDNRNFLSGRLLSGAVTVTEDVPAPINLKPTTPAASAAKTEKG